MVTYRDVVNAFFDLREARSRYDRTWILAESEIRYTYNGKDIAIMTMDRMRLTFSCFHDVTRGLLKRFSEFARILKERYGIDAEFRPIYVDQELYDVLCRIGNTMYILYGEITLDLEKKTVVYTHLAPRVYSAKQKVEPLINIDTREAFRLTIGAVGDEFVAKFTKYNTLYLKALQKMYHRIPIHWLAKFWMPINDNRYYVETIVYYVDRDAYDKLLAFLKLAIDT